MFNPHEFFAQFKKDLFINIYDDTKQVSVSGWQFLVNDVFKKLREEHNVNPKWERCSDYLDPYARFTVGDYEIFCTGWARLNC